MPPALMDRIITLASYVPTPTPLFCSLRDHSFPFDVVRPVPAFVLDFSSPFLALPLSLFPPVSVTFPLGRHLTYRRHYLGLCSNEVPSPF